MSTVTTTATAVTFQPGTRVVIIPRDIYARVLNGQGEVRAVLDEDRVLVDLDGGYEQEVSRRDIYAEADVLEGAITLLAPHDGGELSEEDDAGDGWTLLEDPESMPFLLEEPHARRFITEAREDELLIYYRPGQIPGEERLRLMVEVGRCRVVYPATGAVAPVEVVDIDELVTARGGDPDGPDPLGVLRNAEGEYTGVMRRLGAALDSMLYRADGNSALHVALAQGDPAESSAPGNPKTWTVPFSWVSLGGEWSHRAWAATGAIAITVDDYLATTVHAKDVELTVVGRGGATRFVGEALGVYVGRAVRAALAREQARELIGHTSCIGDTPVQESEAWSPERFAILVRALRGDGCWFAGQLAFQEIPGLPR